MEKTLWESIRYLEPLHPRFVSVTYGADGSTRERTHNVVSRVQKETQLTCVPHLTCIGASRGRSARHRARVLGPGHPPHRRAARRSRRPGTVKYEPRADGFAYAADLVERPASRSATSRSPWPLIRRSIRRRRAPSSISTMLKRKIDAGATRAITQFFYDTDMFLRFRDRCAARGHRRAASCRASCRSRASRRSRDSRKRCGASDSRLAGASLRRARRRSRDAQADLRRASRSSRCTRCSSTAWTQFHFYTLNRSELTYAICHALGVRPSAAQGGAVS